MNTSEFARGWRILLLALAGAATTASVTLLYSLGTLVLPLQKAFGWSRPDLQIAISFMSGGVVVASQLAGWANLRWGLRRMALISLAALALTLFAITLIPSAIGWLYLLYFLAPITGTGITFVTWTQLVSQWFDRRRGLALALVLCGSGLSAAILPPLLGWAIERWDWRAAFIVLGGLPLVLTWPLALLWFRASPDAGATPQKAAAAGQPCVAGPSDFRTAVRSRRFWTLNVALTLVVSAIVGMVTNTVPLLRDIGLSATEAGSVFGSFGIALIAGRVIAGWLIDRVWAPGVAAVALAMPAIGCLMLSSAGPASPSWLLVLAVCLVGVGTGAEFDMSAYLVSRYFGLEHYGRLFGIHLGLITAGSMLAPLMYAAMYQASGGYGPLLAYSTTCCVIGPALLLTLGRMPRVGNLKLA
ncbi:MFS transporter [Pelomonas aquatica]|jgi:MFS family permease|uniref:MFS transporter n=3 Tax=Pseudomonadota TaxID=1224 RepID=A0A9X4R953_9BURK|nr:MFS transporter [Pelomonas aquatica]MCY4756598.1 MFS transporter [Pelomonas aquatica]MDG0863953.1 MFS transporter [Pelomonas aquatica]